MTQRDSGVLCAGGRSKFMTLDELRTLPQPEALGTRHKPIHPAQLIDTIVDTFQNGYNMEVARTSFAMNPKATQLFGIIDLAPPTEGASRTWSVGLLSSIDMSSALKLAGGAGVFVCENFMVNGEVVIMRKHTTGLQLEQEINKMVGKSLEVCKANEALISRQEALSIDDAQAFNLLGEALVSNLLPAAKVREAGDLYFKAELEDVKPRSLWGLHSAFTREVQNLNPGRRVPTTVEIGKFFRDRTISLEQPRDFDVQPGAGI